MTALRLMCNRCCRYVVAVREKNVLGKTFALVYYAMYSYFQELQDYSQFVRFLVIPKFFSIQGRHFLCDAKKLLKLNTENKSKLQISKGWENTFFNANG